MPLLQKSLLEKLVKQRVIDSSRILSICSKQGKPEMWESIDLSLVSQK